MNHDWLMTHYWWPMSVDQFTTENIVHFIRGWVPWFLLCLCPMSPMPMPTLIGMHESFMPFVLRAFCFLPLASHLSSFMFMFSSLFRMLLFIQSSFKLWRRSLIPTTNHFWYNQSSFFVGERCRHLPATTACETKIRYNIGSGSCRGAALFSCSALVPKIDPFWYV